MYFIEKYKYVSLFNLFLRDFNIDFLIETLVPFSYVLYDKLFPKYQFWPIGQGKMATVQRWYCS